MTDRQKQIFNQINYTPTMRYPRKGGNNSKASEAQLREIARLLDLGMTQGVVRWDLTTKESYTGWQASIAIHSLIQSSKVKG